MVRQRVSDVLGKRSTTDGKLQVLVLLESFGGIKNRVVRIKILRVV